MPAVFPPRRSLLYMPASNPRALEKARGLPADGLIIDLEDAVAAEAKEGARAIAAAALAAGGYGPRELVLRVNPLDSPWGHADLAAAATMPIDAVLLPKVESADRVRLTVSLLDALGAPELLAVWSMIETPRGVLTVGEIAAASPRLTGPRPRHVGSDEGIARSFDPRPRSPDHRARIGRARRPGAWPRDPRWRSSRSGRRRGFRYFPAGKAASSVLTAGR